MKEKISLHYQFESDTTNETEVVMAESFEEGAKIQQVLTLVEKFMHSCGYQFDGNLIIASACESKSLDTEKKHFHNSLHGKYTWPKRILF